MRLKPTRSGRWPPCCPPGSWSRSRSWPCSGSSAARSWTSTPPGWPCSPWACGSPHTHQAALVDGTVMTLGTIYVVFFADNFVGQFQGFLITLGVPIAAWCGVMLADIALRRRDYAEPELFTAGGPYGDIR